MMNLLKKGSIILLMMFVSIFSAFSAETEEKEFNAGDFIFGHIRNAYGWHITAYNDEEITIPLPVIVKSESRGWFVFSSARLEETGEYEGFRISSSSLHKGRLVEVMPDGSEVRPWDFSITKNVLEILIASALVLTLFFSLVRFYKKNPKKAPKGILGAFEVLVLFIVDEVIKPCIGKGYEKYTPYLLTVFFFILINNVLGMIPIFPGGANVTGNIAVTAVLALITFVYINVFASKDYWKDIFLVPAAPSWLKVPIPIMPILEFVGVFTKPLALMIRLFANILAGHIIELVFMVLIFILSECGKNLGIGIGTGVFSVLFAFFMQVLEVLVVFLQAYVFTLLSAVFIGLSRIEEHAEKE